MIEVQCQQYIRTAKYLWQAVWTTQHPVIRVLRAPDGTNQVDENYQPFLNL